MKKWITHSQKEVFKSFIFKVFHVDRESVDTGAKGTFDLAKCYNWVNMIALNENNEVILVEQYRHGIDDMTLEIPGGAIDPGEDPLVAAKRELLEETGYTSNDWTRLGYVEPNPAFMDNKCYIFLARNCKKTHEQNLDPLEEIDVKLCPLDEVYQKIYNQEINHSLVVAAFYRYLAHEKNS